MTNIESGPSNVRNKYVAPCLSKDHNLINAKTPTNTDPFNL